MSKGLFTLSEAEKDLGITRKTLLKHIGRAGIEVQTDKHDHRVRIITKKQLEELRVVINRIKK